MKLLLAVISLSTIAACSATPSRSVVPNGGPIESRSVSHAAVHNWGRSMMGIALPSAGCFESAYPAVTWSRIACATPARLPLSRSSKIRPALIGNGYNDYLLEVFTPQVISLVIGSFPKVTGVTGVKTVSSGYGCVCGDGNYSLQLNSKYFPTVACGKNANCFGLEQLAYLSPSDPHKKAGDLFIEDWIIGFTAKSVKCPPKSSGWVSFEGACTRFSRAVNIPIIPITQLEDVSVSLRASPTGDSGFLNDGTTVYGMKDIQNDVIDLSRRWSGAEFNVFGDAEGSRAVFNPGSTITVRVEARNTGNQAVYCQTGIGSQTAEMNSLSLIAAPSHSPHQRYPSILFTESNTGGAGPASCDAIAGL
jgi:hypothetical protein